MDPLRITRHASRVTKARDIFPGIEVAEDVRWVDDGVEASAAGSARLMECDYWNPEKLKALAASASQGAAQCRDNVNQA